MWKKPHFLAQLTLLINKKKGAVEWNEDAAKTFGKVKEICAADALLHYLDFQKEFDIYTDSSDHQMRGIISQNGRLVAYWSRKLSATQKKYPTIEQELLAIVKCLKDFQHMLLGQKLKIYTDHKNLTY